MERIFRTILILSILAVSSVIVSVPVSAQEKPYGGTMTVAATASLKTLNPARITSYDWVTYCLYYDFLWVYDMNFEAVPYLAESWEISPDGLTTTFHLRKNAYWHDGERLTAEDVKFTFDTIMWDPIWLYAIASVESCEVIDDYTIVFHQSAPRARLPMPYSMIIPKHIWEPMLEEKGILDAVLAHDETALAQMAEWPNLPLVGSGIFKMKNWVQGEYMELEAFDKWWGGRPYLDRLIFKEFASTDSALLALKTGEIDSLAYYVNVPPAAVKDLQAQPGITVLDCKSLGDLALSFNLWDGWTTEHPEAAVLQDINVRKALAHCIDRKTIVDVLYLGYATPIYSYIPPALSYWYNPDVTKYEYDLTKAAEILDNAGYKAGADGIRRSPKGLKLSLELTASSEWPTQIRIAEMIRDNAEKVGIELKIVTVDYTALMDMLYYTEGPRYDLAVTSQMEASPDPDWVSTFFYRFKPGEWNFHGYANAEYDALWEAQTTNPDRVSRKEQIFRMQEIVAEDLPAVPIASEDVLRPYRSDRWDGVIPEVGGVFNWIMPWWNAQSIYSTTITATTTTTTEAAPAVTAQTVGAIFVVIIVIALLGYAVMRRRKPKG